MQTTHSSAQAQSVTVLLSTNKVKPFLCCGVWMILRADKQNKSCFSCFSWNIRNPILNTAAVSNYRNNSEACVGALLHPGLPDFVAAVVYKGG